MLTRKTNPMIKILNNSLIDLPTPSNISYMWNIGSLLGMCLLIQIMSGLFLSFHYSSDITTAFDSVSHISRDVNSGWMMRFTHANGASLFFIMLYIHIGRGLYYSSFHKMQVWFSGTMVILMLMATAFLGYVLPWGQMSFWGATVITNLLSAIPYVGKSITYWIWGGFSVEKATLSRFFSLHFILPFLVMMLVIIHLMFLHESGSSNPMGLSNNTDKMTFHPFFTLKDTLGMFTIISIFTYIILIDPYKLNDPENFIPANPLITPPHIQPEWYFLFAYAILRSIPNKLGGVMALFSSITIIMILPISMKNKFSPTFFYPMNKIMFWLMINIFIILTFIGARPVEDPFITTGQLTTTLYFLYFLIMPFM